MDWNDYFNDEDFFDNNFFENNTEFDEKVKKFRHAMRHRHNNHNDGYNDFPTVDVTERLIMFCLSQDKYEEALDFCNLWIEYCPTAPEPKKTQSMIYSLLARHRDAIKAADEALQLSPNYIAAMLNKAIALESIGEPSAALEILNEILEIDPDNFMALEFTAITHKSLGNYNDAIFIFEEIIETDPEEVEPDTYARTAYCYNAIEDFEKAIEYFEKAIDLDPYNDNYWCNLGIATANYGDKNKAIDAFKMALSINDKSFVSLNGIAKAYGELANYSEAIEYFRQALIAKPNDIDTLNHYASVLADSGDYVQAINCYQQVLVNSQLNFRALFGIAVCYDALNDTEKTLEYFDKAQQIKPNHPGIIFMRAEIHYDSANYTAALEVLHKALDDTPDDIALLHFSGKCYFQLNDYDNAALYFEKILKTVCVRGLRDYFNELRLLADTYFWLAKIYAIQRDLDKSVDMLIKAFMFDSKKKLEYLMEFPELLGKKYSKFNKLLKHEEQIRRKRLIAASEKAASKEEEGDKN
jgi:tetratricopeptide (TPR) repeat protein